MSRIDKIFKEIVEEEKPQMDDIQMRTQKIHHNLLDIQKRILEHARKTCSKEFEQVETNGEILFDDTGYKVRVKDNQNVDADANMGNFVDCLSRNDFGMKEFFDIVNTNLKAINENSNKCLDSCVDYEWDKTDTELKGCMRKCTIDVRKEFSNNFNLIEKQIADVLAKL
jgi:hypothetical protein